MLARINRLYSGTKKQLKEEVEPLLDDLVLEDEEATKRQREVFANEDKKLEKVIIAYVAIMILTNKKAITVINKELPEIYSLNSNFMFKNIEKIAGIILPKPKKSTLTNKHTLRAYDELKDTRYVKKEIMEQLTQGIKKGESTEKLIQRVRNTSNYPLNRCKNIATTEFHRLENASRFEAALELEKLGVKQTKTWKHSGRMRSPRQWHIKMNDETVGLHEPFSNGAMYPGDYRAGAKEVCHCACYMTTNIIEVVK